MKKAASKKSSNATGGLGGGSAPWKSKIVGHDRVSPDQLIANPLNFRTHPMAQREALREAIAEVGFIRSVTVNKRTGHVVDGHERLQQALQSRQPFIDVEYVDLSESEERLALATMDPISEMAQVDSKMLDSLLREVNTGSEALAGMLSDLAIAPELLSEDGDKPADRATLESDFSILIRCENESEQKVLLEELDNHGLETRALCIGWPAPPPVEREDAAPIEASGIRIVRKSTIKKSARVKQLAGIYDLPPKSESQQEWVVDLKLDRDWHVGLIVGPSGCGKTTIARELFGDKIVSGWDWPSDGCILDGFHESMSVGDIVNLLSSVGFSSPPHWLKPFHVLSNGEQFRVNLARTMAELPDLAVVDEFTSVVDRTVAKIGSCAVAKAVRASNRRLVAVACHYDIEDWLQPDWKYEPATGKFTWRCLRRRPEIQLRIRRVDGKEAWPLFRGHHYLSGDLHRSAACFMATVDNQPAAFTAVLHAPGQGGGWWREHRSVCLPDFQGVGIGTALSDFIAACYRATGKRYRSTTSHPAMIGHRGRSANWRMHKTPCLSSATASPGFEAMLKTQAMGRLTAGFEYTGPARTTEAALLRITKPGTAEAALNQAHQTSPACPSMESARPAVGDSQAASTTAQMPTGRRPSQQRSKSKRGQPCPE